MQFPIHARPSDEIGHLAVVVLASGVEDADNPLDHLVDFNPAAIFLTSSNDTDVDIVWDHLAPADVQLFSLHHHNIPAGTDVRLQRNATNAWGAPTIDAPVIIAPYPQAGLPYPLAIDLTAADGYDTDAPLRYTRLHIPSLDQFVGLGSALLWAAKRTDWDPVLPANVFVEQQAATLFKTTLGVRRGYRKGIRLRSKPFSQRQEDAGWAAFLALFREVSSVTPFLWWPDPTHSADAWLAAIDSDTLQESRPVEPIHEFAGRLEELACGGAIPTAAELIS